jgi:Cu+-exporting ATPase
VPDVTAVAAALAAHSPDPRAAALLGGAAFPPSISGISVDDAGTVRATTGARTVALGRPEALGPDLPEELGTPDLVVAWDGQARAGFTVATGRHPDAPDAVRALRGLGLTVVLLTSAADDAAQTLAEGLDIDLVLPAAGPAGKVEVIRRLRADGHGVVVAAGPGAAHAVAADLPLAVGATDGSGGLGIAAGSPRDAATAVRLARRISGVAEGGLAIALGAALVGLPAAAAGLVHPLLAAAIGPAVTGFVVLNGLRLRRA